VGGEVRVAEAALSSGAERERRNRRSPASDRGVVKSARGRPPARAPEERGLAGRFGPLGGGFAVVAEVDVVEVGVGAVCGEVDAGVDASVEDERGLVEFHQPRCAAAPARRRHRAPGVLGLATSARAQGVPTPTRGGSPLVPK
jgi:hypothetical protein